VRGRPVTGSVERGIRSTMRLQWLCDGRDGRTGSVLLDLIESEKEGRPTQSLADEPPHIRPVSS
jgi:hypothetical protein